VIGSFRDRKTKAFFEGLPVRQWRAIQPVAKRKLDQLAAAKTLHDMRVPPGNRLEALKGDRAGQHSVRINDQFRLCFRWEGDAAHDVEIVDYH
jgi:proteic killer suppression protein